MKRKRSKLSITIPISLNFRTALWISLDYVRCIDAYSQSESVVLDQICEIFQAHDGEDQLVDIEFSERELSFSRKCIRLACQYLDRPFPNSPDFLDPMISKALEEYASYIRLLNDALSNAASQLR